MKNPDTGREALLLGELIETFERLGISVEFANLSFDDIQGKGGLCRVRDREKIILDRRLTVEDMNELLASELAKMDVEDIYLSPVVREAVERHAR